MKFKQLPIFATITFLMSLPSVFTWAMDESALTPKQALGKQLFFDPRLSSPPGQSCASCHAPQTGFADPRSEVPVSEGIHKGRFTARNSPSVTYLARVPALHFDEEEQLYIGGLFYDGRADTLEAQIEGPMFSPAEMANENKSQVVARLARAGYQPAFKQVYGDNVLADAESGFQQITDAIAAYERSHELNAFTSRYDAYLQQQISLTPQELRGLRIYEAEDKGNCAACHPSRPGEHGEPPLFTDFSYDNLGTPANPDSPFLSQDKQFNPLGHAYIDIGLGKTVKDIRRNGKVRVPTLRNIELTAPYMHNGVFKTLQEVVDFYNTRDVDKKWSKPEVAENVNREELGDLKLKAQEVQDLVVFLKTLTDGYMPAKP